MTSPISAQLAQDKLVASVRSLEQANTTIQFKARWLKQHKSSDAIQQMQTDAIPDLCDAVQQIQQAMAAMAPLMLPPVSAVRAAAAATTTSTTPFKRF
jgi:hypothetical protein